MIELTRDNFEAEVLNNEGLVIVDYWGEGCVPCMSLMPDFESLEATYSDKVKFAKLNTTAERKLALSQRVLGLPTIVLYSNGERVAELKHEKANKMGIEALISAMTQGL
jgi:thioredoxin 1